MCNKYLSQLNFMWYLENFFTNIWEHRFKIMFTTFIEISASSPYRVKPIAIQCCLIYSNKNHPFWAASFGFSQLIAYKILYVFFALVKFCGFVAVRYRDLYFSYRVKVLCHIIQSNKIYLLWVLKFGFSQLIIYRILLTMCCSYTFYGLQHVRSFHTY